MSQLCSKADIILPNISEACFMLNRKYVGENASPETIKELLWELIKLGSKYAVITGVTLPNGELGFIGYDSSNKDFLCTELRRFLLNLMEQGTFCKHFYRCLNE